MCSHGSGRRKRWYWCSWWRASSSGVRRSCCNVFCHVEMAARCERQGIIWTLPFGLYTCGTTCSRCIYWWVVPSAFARKLAWAELILLEWTAKWHIARGLTGLRAGVAYEMILPWSVLAIPFALWGVATCILLTRYDAVVNFDTSPDRAEIQTL
jgi:hypothetical protein